MSTSTFEEKRPAGDNWGWLVPGHPSKPQMSVKPLSFLPGEVFSAGRSSQCNLNLTPWYYEGDPKGPIENVPKLLLSISRIHFEILRKDEKKYIVGRSENGTFVRGEKLQKDQPRPLKHGDVVAVVDPDNNLFMYLHEASILSMNFPTKIKTCKA